MFCLGQIWFRNSMGVNVTTIMIVVKAVSRVTCTCRSYEPHSA